VIKRFINVKSILSIVIIVYFLGGVYLYFFQRSFIYFPTKEVKHNTLVQNFNIDNESIKVHIINNDKQNAILYFGGRSESVAKNVKDFKTTFPNHTVYLLNYRGYGGSSGEATEKNLYNDATFIYNNISQKHKEIIIIGRSLGTGIATYIASTSKIQKMVLVTPYDSILNMAKDKYPFYPISYILKDQYNSIHRVENIDKPTLIVLASNDETINARYSNNLIEKFNPSILNVATIPNTGHKNIIENVNYLNVLKSFVNN